MAPLINVIVNALAVFVASKILPGVHVDTFMTAIIVSVVMALINMLVKPVLMILTLPLTILTLGLFTFILNGLLILLVSSLVKGFTVDNIWWAMLFSLVVSLVGAILHGMAR